MFLISRVPFKYSVGQRCSSLYSVENVFNEENIKRTVAKFSKMKPIRLQPHQPARKAAVLIPLCVVDQQVSLLYTLRASHLKSHRGQVSFPGGMQDNQDKSLEATALRETHEELGIEQDNVEIWGSGNLIVTRGETCVLPVIGRIKEDLVMDQLRVNHHEVDEVFAVSLEDLCDPENLGYTQFKNMYSAPVFKGGPRRIWGLTAFITNAFLRSLLPIRAYSHKIKYVPPIKYSGTRPQIL